MTADLDAPSWNASHSYDDRRRSRAFGLEQTHACFRSRTSRVHATSDENGWISLFVSVQRDAPFAGTVAPVEDELLILHCSGPTDLDYTAQGVRTRTRLPAGAVQIIPSASALHVEKKEAADTVHLYLRRWLIEKVALELVDCDPAKVRLQEGIVEADPVLRKLIEATAALLTGEAGSSRPPVYFLACAIAAHLIKTVSSVSPNTIRWRAAGEVLSEPVSAAVTYMRDNLELPLTISDLAGATGKSRSQISRLVRQELGVSAHRYLITLRAAKARDLLEKTNISIAEIACACGFANQEHLTTTFRRFYQATPAAYRKARRQQGTGAEPAQPSAPAP